jgi:hypothetical protein
MATSDREARLPQWAQNELTNLRRKVADQAKRIGELTGDITGKNVLVRNYEYGDTALPHDSRIAFVFDPDKPRGSDVLVHFGGRNSDELVIQGDRALLVHPAASNSIYITLREY